MTHHVPDDLLHAFVDGDVEERVAVHVAQHLDACPQCATRAATLEPLAAAFAVVPDPEPPATLALAVLAELDRQPVDERQPAVELVAGFLLLAAAAALAVVGGDPIGSLVRLGVLAGALHTASAQVTTLVSGPALVMALGTLTLGAATLVGARTVWAEGRLT